MHTLEPYWFGVGLWLSGFVLHLYGAHWRYSYRIARLGAVLCWTGFAVTALPFLTDRPIPAFNWPTEFDFRNPTTEQIYAVIWIAWFAGFGILAASWLRIVPAYIGWAGFAIGMSATAAARTDDRQLQAVIAIAAILLIVLLLASKTSGSKRTTRPGDYEAELLRLCYGDTGVANRLIKYEHKRHPGFSRQAAAMAAMTRLRRDRH